MTSSRCQVTAYTSAEQARAAARTAAAAAAAAAAASGGGVLLQRHCWLNHERGLLVLHPDVLLSGGQLICFTKQGCSRDHCCTILCDMVSARCCGLAHVTSTLLIYTLDGPAPIDLPMLVQALPSLQHSAARARPGCKRASQAQSTCFHSLSVSTNKYITKEYPTKQYPIQNKTVTQRHVAINALTLPAAL